MSALEIQSEGQVLGLQVRLGFLPEIYYVKNIKSQQRNVIIQGFQHALKPSIFF